MIFTVLFSDIFEFVLKMFYNRTKVELIKRGIYDISNRAT